MPQLCKKIGLVRLASWSMQTWWVPKACSSASCYSSLFHQHPWAVISKYKRDQTAQRSTIKLLFFLNLPLLIKLNCNTTSHTIKGSGCSAPMLEKVWSTRYKWDPIPSIMIHGGRSDHVLQTQEPTKQKSAAHSCPCYLPSQSHSFFDCPRYWCPFNPKGKWWKFPAVLP